MRSAFSVTSSTAGWSFLGKRHLVFLHATMSCAPYLNSQRGKCCVVLFCCFCYFYKVNNKFFSALKILVFLDSNSVHWPWPAAWAVPWVGGFCKHRCGYLEVPPTSLCCFTSAVWCGVMESYNGLDWKGLQRWLISSTPHGSVWTRWLDGRQALWLWFYLFGISSLFFLGRHKVNLFLWRFLLM